MTQTAHPVSQKIRSLYEAYPYPPHEEGMLLDPYLDTLLSFSGQAPEGRPSFLDAGCGTGMMMMGGARLYPHFDVYGCDFNSTALAQVKQDAESYGVKNLVEVREVDLLDFPQDFGPERGFDVIFLTGVIHHTPDPLKVLKSVANRLAPNGVIRLMVYSELGRSALYRFARVAKKLFNHDGVDWETRVGEAQLLMFELFHAGLREGKAPPCLRGPFEGSHELSDAEFADRYLNPHDVPFTVNSLQQLVQDSGLQFHSWFERRKWSLAHLLPNMARNGYVPSDPWQEFAMIDELFDRDQFDLYLVRPGFQPQAEPLGLQTLLGANPQAELTDSYFRGFPYQSSAKLLFYPEEELTIEEARLMRSVGREWKSLETLLGEWGEQDSGEWLSIATSLVERELLFRPHPKSQ